MNIPLKDLLLGILVTVMWGCNFVVIDIGLHELDPFLLTFLRFFFCTFPAIFFIKRPQNVKLSIVALYGVLFGCGLWWTVNFAMYNGLSAGLASLFLQFSAFFTIILSFILFKEKINTIQIAGIVTAFLGLCLLIFNSFGQQSTLIGVLLVLLAACAWATCNIIVKLNKPDNMVAFIVWSSLFSFPAIFVMTIIFKGTQPFLEIQNHLTPRAWFSILFQAYITTIFGYRVWNNLMKKYPVSSVAPLSLLVPISGITAAYFFLGEHVSFLEGTAIIVVLLGIALFMNAGLALNMLSNKKA